MTLSHAAPAAGVEQVLATLLELMQVSESDSARIAAAKILLERLAPKIDEEARQREADERDAALADARGLLAEFAAAKLAGLYQPDALDQDCAARTIDAADDPGCGFAAAAARITEPASGITDII